MRIIIIFFTIVSFNSFANCDFIPNEQWKLDQTQTSVNTNSDEYGFWVFMIHYNCQEPNSLKYWQHFNFSNFGLSNRRKSDEPTREIQMLKMANPCIKNGKYITTVFNSDLINAMTHALFDSGYINQDEFLFPSCT